MKKKVSRTESVWNERSWNTISGVPLNRRADSHVRKSREGGSRGQGCPRSWRNWWPVLTCSIAIASTLFTASCAKADGAEPVVSKVEPPGWWLEHSHNPVRLLITGDHLEGANVETPDGFTFSNVTVSANGDYLFADLFIAGDASPGDKTLWVRKGEGKAAVRFELMKPLRGNGKFGGFTTDDVIYLLMPDRFANGDASNDDPAESRGLHDRGKPRHYHGGDFAGIRERLPYLRELGVTALWLTPWYDNVNQLNQLEKYSERNQLSPRGVPSTDYHGYGAVDFYGVEEHLGSMEDLLELISAARSQGFKFIQDQVANHTGPYHPWVTNPPTPTWFNGTVENHLANNWQIWTAAASNPPPDQLKATVEGWFIDLLPDLNQNDPEAARYLIQNSLWWVGMTGVDAVRQDTLPYVPRAHWAHWTASLKQQFPDLTILGELYDGNAELVAFFQGGRPRFDGIDTGVDTLFDFPMYYAIRDVFANGVPMTRLSDTLAADTNYVNPDVLVTFLGLHDTARFVSERGATLDGLKRAFTFLLTARGTPLIYYGDEIGMNGGGDPHNRRDFPGGWAEHEQNAFEAESRTPEQQSVHRHVKKLMALRRELEPLRRGAQEFLFIDSEVCVYQRTTGDGAVTVAINNGSRAREITLKLTDQVWQGVPGLTDRLGRLGEVNVVDGAIKIKLPAGEAAVFVPVASAARTGN